MTAITATSIDTLPPETRVTCTAESLTRYSQHLVTQPASTSPTYLRDDLAQVVSAKWCRFTSYGLLTYNPNGRKGLWYSPYLDHVTGFLSLVGAPVDLNRAVTSQYGPEANPQLVTCSSSRIRPLDGLGREEFSIWHMGLGKQYDAQQSSLGSWVKSLSWSELCRGVTPLAPGHLWIFHRPLKGLFPTKGMLGCASLRSMKGSSPTLISPPSDWDWKASATIKEPERAFLYSKGHSGAVCKNLVVTRVVTEKENAPGQSGQEMQSSADTIWQVNQLGKHAVELARLPTGLDDRFLATARRFIRFHPPEITGYDPAVSDKTLQIAWTYQASSCFADSEWKFHSLVSPLLCFSEQSEESGFALYVLNTNTRQMVWTHKLEGGSRLIGLTHLQGILIMLYDNRQSLEIGTTADGSPVVFTPGIQIHYRDVSPGEECPHTTSSLPAGITDPSLWAQRRSGDDGDSAAMLTINWLSAPSDGFVSPTSATYAIPQHICSRFWA